MRSLSLAFLSQGGDRVTLRRTVRVQFKQNAALTDATEVREEGDVCVSGGALALCRYPASTPNLAASPTPALSSFLSPSQIEAAKAAAVRGLSNYMFHEAQRLAAAKKE